MEGILHSYGCRRTGLWGGPQCKVASTDSCGAGDVIKEDGVCDCFAYPDCVSQTVFCLDSRSSVAQNAQRTVQLKASGGNLLFIPYIMP